MDYPKQPPPVESRELVRASDILEYVNDKILFANAYRNNNNLEKIRTGLRKCVSVQNSSLLISLEQELSKECPLWRSDVYQRVPAERKAGFAWIPESEYKHPYPILRVEKIAEFLGVTPNKVRTMLANMQDGEYCIELADKWVRVVSVPVERKAGMAWATAIDKGE
jgi:hypothetical protein